MKLASLPPEILDLILYGSSTSYAAITLWLCGDSILNPKLLSGLTYLCLRADESVRADFPRVAFKFRETTYPLGKSTFIDLGALFPRLERLELKEMDCYDLPGLPPSLRVLSAPLLLDYRSTKVASVLPRSLLRLESVATVGNDLNYDVFLEDWSRCPPHLEYVDRYTWLACSDDRVATGSWLPQSLKELDLSLQWNFDCAHAFPHLEILKLTKSPNYESFTQNRTTWLAELPKSLTVLQLPPFDSADQLGNIYQQLPRSLTDITMSSLTLDTFRKLEAILDSEGPEKFYNNWPPLLRRLRMRAYDISSRIASLLPRSLSELDISLDRHGRPKVVYEIDASQLPPKLTILSLYSRSPFSFICIKNQLPSMITDLSISSESDGLTHLLPKSITNLIIKIDWKSGDTWTLPPMLTDLDIGDWHYNWFKLLPSNLQFLSIRTLHLPYDIVSNPGTRVYEHLPRSLQYIYIQLVDRNVEGHDIIKWASTDLGLSPHLETLSMISAGSFKSQIVRGLPRTLRVLSVDLESLDLDDAIFLPSMLRVCNLGSRFTLNTEEMVRIWPVRTLHHYIDVEEEDLEPVVKDRIHKLFF